MECVGIVSICQLTVARIYQLDTHTQYTQHHSDEEEGTGVGFMARDDASRYVYSDQGFI